MEFSLNAMWDDIQAADVTEEVKSAKVPIYFFEGRYDMATPTVLVEDLYNSLEDIIESAWNWRRRNPRGYSK